MPRSGARWFLPVVAAGLAAGCGLKPASESAVSSPQPAPPVGTGISSRAPIRDVPARAPEPAAAGYLGIGLLLPAGQRDRELRGLKPGEIGLVASNLVDGGPAAEGGLEEEDVLLAFNGAPLEGVDDLTRKVAASAPGSTAVLGIVRGRRRFDVRIAIGRRPDE